MIRSTIGVIPLNTKEMGMLNFLFRSDTFSATRQIILQEVWGYNAAAITHTLETHVYMLRQKMEPDPKCPTLLVTVNGGYCLGASGAAWPTAAACGSVGTKH